MKAEKVDATMIRETYQNLKGGPYLVSKLLGPEGIENVLGGSHQNRKRRPHSKGSLRYIKSTQGPKGTALQVCL